MRGVAARHRWGIRLGVVALVAMLAFGSAVRPSSPAEAAPADHGGVGTALQDGDGIDGTLWAACKAFSDLLDFAPFDPRRPFDFSEWKLPPEIAFNYLKLVLGNLKTVISVAVGESLLGRITGAGTTIEEWFVQQINKWTPPAGKHAPEWYRTEITRFLECELVEKEVREPCGAVPQLTSVKGAFIPDHCWGTFPANNYDLGYNQGSPLTRGPKDLWGLTANLLFSLAASAVQLGLWIMGWAFSLDMRKYDVFALQIGNNYQNRLVGPLDLMHIAWLVLIGWAGFTALRNRAGMAVGEIAVSFVMLGLSLVFMANRGGYLGGVWDLMDEGSNLVLSAAQDKEPCGDQVPMRRGQSRDADGHIPNHDPCADYKRTTLAPVQKEIQKVFIEQPYDYLNWGRLLEHAECKTARDEIVSVGPHGDDGWPRRHMARAAEKPNVGKEAAQECRAAARFNANPSSARWIGALLNLVAAVCVFVMLGLSSITLILAKFLTALLFALAPFAAVAAILPGGGRRLAWQWFGTLVQTILAVLGISLAISLMLVAMYAVLGASAGVGIVERWVIVLVVVSAVLVGRRQIVAGTQSAAAGIADKLTRMSPAGASAGPVNAGMNLAGGDTAVRRVAQGSAIAVGAAATGAGLMFAQRMRERRAWHNIVKARRVGDREQGVVNAKYYSNAGRPAPTSGSVNGPGPRYGYGVTGSGPGSPPGGGPTSGGLREIDETVVKTYPWQSARVQRGIQQRGAREAQRRGLLPMPGPGRPGPPPRRPPGPPPGPPPRRPPGPPPGPPPGTPGRHRMPPPGTPGRHRMPPPGTRGKHRMPPPGRHRRPPPWRRKR